MDDDLEKKVLLKILKDVKEIKEQKTQTGNIDSKELKQMKDDIEYLVEAVGMLLDIQTEQIKNSKQYRNR